MRKQLKIISLVCAMLMMFNIVAFADEAPKQADLSERTSWEKNAAVHAVSDGDEEAIVELNDAIEKFMK